MPIDTPVAESQTARYKVAIHRDVRIPTGIPQESLSADVYLPLDADPVPALVTVVPYRKDIGSGYATSLMWFAERGYGCVLVDNAGTGSSDGVAHPPWGSGEIDDSVTAIEWAAEQPWCTGSVGMWGISHGGFASMGAASRGVPHLKAIIPIANALDAERDALHPDGARGDLVRLALWGGSMLLQQLLPPLFNHTSEQEQRRWRQRMHDVEPFLVDLAGLSPGHPALRERVIDPARIAVPSLCVGGWQDLYSDAVPRAYEQIHGPKKLLIGPWGHTLPQDSPFGAIEFLAIALRWWDYWLRGADNGVMDEPPVTLYLQGSEPGWRSYKSWPPADAELVLATGADTTLTTTSNGAFAAAVIGEYRPDPTTGALSGLRGIGLGQIGLPMDQHDDDVRALSATSDPLTADLLIAGRPSVSVRLATQSVGGNAVKRIVVRLADVDPHGRSNFIAIGVLCPSESQEAPRIVLSPACYRVPAGNQLRVVISDSDFPRLTPLPDPCRIRITGVELSLPVAAEDAGSPVHVSAASAGPAKAAIDTSPSGATGSGRWAITRDPIHDGVDIEIGWQILPTRTSQGHLLDMSSGYRATVRRDAPDAAVTTGTHTAKVRMSTGEAINARATVRCTQTALWAQGELIVDGHTVFSRSWDAPLEHSHRERQ